MNLIGNPIKFTENGKITVKLMLLDGCEAFQFLRNNPVDVAILDMQMPEMSGIEVCRAIVSERPPHALPMFLMLSANVGHEDM
jgi:CheY-like chemotaxis protein